MAAPDLDVIKDIPGYKVILKAVIKSQIQLLVEQLAAHTDEESIILTASVADGTLSHLGSDSGRSFLEGHEDVKSQFLGFCLKYQHKKKQETQRERLEQELQQKQVLLQQQMRSSTPFSPEGPSPHFMPSRSPRHYSARYPYGARHEPYHAMQPNRKPLNFNHTGQSPCANQSATKSDGQVIKIEAEDNENSDQSSSETTTPNTPGAEKGNKAGLSSPTVEPTNKESDDSESEASAIPERLDLEIENLISGAEKSVSNTQMSESQAQSSELDPNVSVKFEAVTEPEMDFEITGIEPGRPGIPQENWTSKMSVDMNFNPATAPGSTTDLCGSQQGYTFFGSDARFSCDVCCKSFPTKWELKRHYRTHTGEKPFECQICGKRFTVKCNLNSHIMCVHQYAGLRNSFDIV